MCRATLQPITSVTGMRIMAIAERANSGSANAIGEQIRSAVATFTGLMPANDDLSLMVLKRL